WLPHEYATRQWCAAHGLEAEFVAMVERIRRYGYVERFGRRRTFVYWQVDDWRYWSMGAPVAETTVLNRCRVDERGLPAQGPRWLREPLPLDAQACLPGLER